MLPTLLPQLERLRMQVRISLNDLSEYFLIRILQMVEGGSRMTEYFSRPKESVLRGRRIQLES